MRYIRGGRNISYCQTYTRTIPVISGITQRSNEIYQIFSFKYIRYKTYTDKSIITITFSYHKHITFKPFRIRPSPYIDPSGYLSEETSRSIYAKLHIHGSHIFFAGALLFPGNGIFWGSSGDSEAGMVTVLFS